MSVLIVNASRKTYAVSGERLPLFWPKEPPPRPPPRRGPRAVIKLINVQKVVRRTTHNRHRRIDRGPSRYAN